MPIDVRWDDMAETLLYVNLVLPWDWAEFRQAVEKAQIILEATEDKRAILVDVREAGDIPPAGFLAQSRHALQQLPLLPMIFIANTDIMRMIFSPLIYVLPSSRQFFFVRNLEKARAIVDSEDQSSKRIV